MSMSVVKLRTMSMPVVMSVKKKALLDPLVNPRIKLVCTYEEFTNTFPVPIHMSSSSFALKSVYEKL